MPAALAGRERLAQLRGGLPRLELDDEPLADTDGQGQFPLCEP